MTRRIVLPAAVLLALVAALAGALLAPAPGGGLPAVALGSTLVWRVEVAAVVFAAAYGAIVTTRLALHGHTYTRVGSSGIEIPQVARNETGQATTRSADLSARVDRLQSTVSKLASRLEALEHARHLLLNPDEEET